MDRKAENERVREYLRLEGIVGPGGLDLVGLGKGLILGSVGNTTNSTRSVTVTKSSTKSHGF